MKHRSDHGFTLMEVVMATAIMAIALLGLALAIPVAVQANNRNRVDAEATMLAQREIEQMTAQPLTASSFTDASGNLVSLAPGGSALAGGKINFLQPAVTGYSATVQGTSGHSYELRWNVQSLPDGAKQFTVGARKIGPQRYLMPPVNISARQGK